MEPQLKVERNAVHGPRTFKGPKQPTFWRECTIWKYW